VLRRLELGNWRQFGSVDIEFHDRLTVLTGANGSGKTTVLSLLSQHFGWSFQYLSEPRLDRKRALRYFSGADDELEIQGNRHLVGKLTYASGHESSVSVPREVAAQYDVSIDNRQQVDGIFLPSHRPVYSYQPVEEIPTRVDARDQLFEQYLTNLRGFWISRSRVESPSLRLKRSLISLATFGYGNQAVEANDEARETFEGFQSVLATVLPDHIGFHRLTVRSPEVVLETASGTFSLDAASGGVAALVDLSWQIFMRSLLSDRFVVVADEPENHLHPALQRDVMPKMIAAFPRAQFVVATHNPFVVGSVRDSNVYALQFADNRVYAELLDLADKSGTANDVLREVLGVPVPLPLWVEREVDRLVQQLDLTDVTQSTLRQLRDGLAALGLERQFPGLLNRLTSGDERAQADEDS